MNKSYCGKCLYISRSNTLKCDNEHSAHHGTDINLINKNNDCLDFVRCRDIQANEIYDMYGILHVPFIDIDTGLEIGDVCIGSMMHKKEIEVSLRNEFDICIVLESYRPYYAVSYSGIHIPDIHNRTNADDVLKSMLEERDLYKKHFNINMFGI